jgi:hypothetical protein
MSTSVRAGRLSYKGTAIDAPFRVCSRHETILCLQEIGTKHVTCRVAAVHVRGSTMKIICLSLAFVLAASVAVFSMTSSPSSVRAETVANHFYR